MRNITRFIVVGIIIAIALLVQQGGFLNVYGVVPNMVLIVLIVFASRREPWRSLAVVAVGTIAIATLIAPWWLVECAAVVGVALLARASIQWLTGNATLDFFLLIAGSSFAFYGLLVILRVSLFSLSMVAGDMFYAMFFGGLVWYGMKNYGKKTITI